ncbi:Alpha/Beta hydrolase protein [Phascolomyces articulosus]|uniref:sn-1-specific diacylglycerol lipase n=1 Tax=Phascolomyces articulosus TaxID=60185 RepID=A0AAD5P8G2_9FUNG|nr:Alpha/Beta hydrolase protein [Phascolomyces articulosus]
MAVSAPTSYPTSIYHDSPTLLPEHLASFVTAASLAARVSLRCSSVFVDAIFEAAKYGTVLSLGISRQALTNALATAKRNGFLRILDKYTNLGIYIVHNTFTLAELFALSGLQLTSQTVRSGFKTAEESVRIIDGIFGSNETSRAIASIITLVHKELMQDPDFVLANSGKMTMLAGLTKAMTAFAVLQFVTHKRMMKQTKFTVDKYWQSNPLIIAIANIARFMRYASAAYGETFMRILGIGNIPSVIPTTHHSNHHAFVHHTGLALEDILLSSYTDRSFLTMHHPSIHELVHYVTVDHAAQAIVLTCRGTLGLSDVLTDLTCGYSDITLPDVDSSEFMAHGGMLDAAQMLAKEKGKVFRAIRDGLERYPDYGLVLTGHSLGGGVASLVSLLWSEKDKQGNFVLSPTSGLASGRPIHCYVYGPPCVMSLELSQYCRGLVTSVVHRYDIVSCLSLGLLKDFKNVAVSLHTEAEVTDQILTKVIHRYRSTSSTVDDSEDDWFWALIKTMRADMRAEKLYPPSTVYTIELIPSRHKQSKAVLSRCDDIQARFSEIVFSRTMFMDHSPTNYEHVIKQLCKGFFGQDTAYEQL